VIVLTGTATLPVAAPRADDLGVRAALLHTSGPLGTIENGALLIRGGKIAAVGRAEEVAFPSSLRVLEAAVVTPGLIDAHGVTGLAGAYNVPADQDQDERTGPNQAGLRAIDGFNPEEQLLRWLLRHGVTALQAGPGEANPIGGLAGVFKTHGGSLDEVLVRFPSALVFTLGEAPKRTYAADRKPPVTRMGTAALIRGALLEASEYAVKRKQATGLRIPLLSGSKGEAPERDLSKEALGRALRGEIPALFTARREDDLETALRIGREFGLRVVLADAVEAYLMADRIREAGVPVLVGPVMERPGRHETINQSFENAAILQAAGIPIAFQSGFESYVPKTRVVLFEAAVAVAYGLPDAAALRALTIDSARLLGVDDRLGSLEPGKDADVVLFDGDPLEYTSHIEAVIVNGGLAWQRGPESR
jgi:imidazolonepropionase-like amidohydrolase